jgi:transcriptional regulator with XRE-family HTH domain
MATAAGPNDLAFKIAKLVEERGWNQEDFARIANLNRHTIRQILHADQGRRLRNDTVNKCATALGLTVNDLRTLPLEKLLPRMHGKPGGDDEALKQLHTQATLPELVSWLERNPERSLDLTAAEIAEILAVQEPGGALEKLGVEQFIEMLERRRKLLDQVRIIASSEYLPTLEQLVGLMHDKLQRPLFTQRARL